MSDIEIAAAVLECVGGKANVQDNSLCATRLRINVINPSLVNRNALNSIRGVLGIASRGDTRIEIVFGPNLVKGVYKSFVWLTGLSGDSEQPSEHSLRHTSNMHVQITPEMPGKPVATFDVSIETSDISDDDDTSALLNLLRGDDPTDLGDLLEEVPDDEADELASLDDDMGEAPDGSRILVLNGPNVNMLGITGPDDEDAEGFSQIIGLCHEAAESAGFVTCECFQSNHEGELVDRIQDAFFQQVDAIVINAGSYARTSMAIPDALRAVAIPTVEVILAATGGSGDGPSPQASYVGDACVRTIADQGIEGYRLAISLLADLLGIS